MGKRKPSSHRKPKSAALLELRGQAKRDGWLKWVRQGEGEEADEKAMLNGCSFDLRRAQHPVDFFERYGVLTEGAWAGQSFRLLPWQHDWLFRGFGWVKYSTEWDEIIRRFRYLFLEVPKKNGKTPLIATLGNYLLFADSYGRQINMFLAATSKQQAARCLKHATRAYKYERCEDLARCAVTKKLEGYECVEYGDNLWQVVAADAASADGINGHVLGDEIHRWKGLEFYNTLRWALASQPEGLFVAITTAGSDPESVWATLNQKTKKVNAGHESDQQFFGQIYAIEKDEDPHDEKTWLRVNPSLGSDRASPLKLSTFRADYEAAKLDPTQWPTWLQLRLGRARTGQDTWIEIEKWDLGKVVREAQQTDKRLDCYEEYSIALNGKPFNQTRLEELRRFFPVGDEAKESPECQFEIQIAGQEISPHELDSIMALDGATINDTTSATFTLEHPVEDGVLFEFTFYWLPENRAIELQKKVGFKNWQELGFVTLTPGDALDFDVVFHDLTALMQAFGVQSFYFDPLFQAEWLTQKLEAETGAERIEFPQTITFYSPAMKAAQRHIVNRTLRHNGHPILTWQLGNTRAKSNVNSDIRPIKQKHGDYRSIDGIATLIMTMNNWATVADGGSFYDDNELELI